MTMRELKEVCDPNPWRYPSRGELPEKAGLYDVSGDFWGDQPQFIAGLFWTGEYWYWSETSDTNEEEDLNRVVYAWRESTIPAPRLEEVSK